MTSLEPKFEVSPCEGCGEPTAQRWCDTCNPVQQSGFKDDDPRWKLGVCDFACEPGEIDRECDYHMGRQPDFEECPHCKGTGHEQPFTANSAGCAHCVDGRVLKSNFEEDPRLPHGMIVDGNLPDHNGDGGLRPCDFASFFRWRTRKMGQADFRAAYEWQVAVVERLVEHIKATQKSGDGMTTQDLIDASNAQSGKCRAGRVQYGAGWTTCTKCAGKGCESPLPAWRIPDHLRRRVDPITQTLYEEGYRAGLACADELPTAILGEIEDSLCRNEIQRSPNPWAEIVGRLNTQRRSIRSYHERIAALQMHLGELHALVWGECPSLLNEDSGGNSRLDGDIVEALKRA